MKVKINDAVLELVEGDITEQTTEAVVNAANRTLLGGSGVDGAIHRAAGPQVMGECRRLGGCEPGDAKLTCGGNLVARHIIHAVGPVYRDGRHRESDLLRSCYQRALEIAQEHGIRTVAFPSISTGAYRYPTEAASRIALGTVIDYLKESSEIKLVRFVLQPRRIWDAYAGSLEELLRSPGCCDMELVEQAV